LVSNYPLSRRWFTFTLFGSLLFVYRPNPAIAQDSIDKLKLSRDRLVSYRDALGKAIQHGIPWAVDNRRKVSEQILEMEANIARLTPTLLTSPGER
jgi:hypothetical protein